MKLFIYTVTLLSSCVLLEACRNSTISQSSKVTEVDYTQLGDSLSNIAQQTLLMEVSSHLQSEGVVSTLEYCNINAIPIMDSLSEIYHASISRISEKNRNPNNAANKEELVILKYLSNNKKDTLIEKGTEIFYYKSIRLGMPACIKCHGIPEKDISSNALHILDSLYPTDKARNYSFGDFRGAWKIRFKKE